MMFTNASEARLAVWTGAAGIVLGAVLVGGVALGRLHPRAGGADRTGRTDLAEVAGLAPDAAALRYRYAIRASSDGADDTAGAIAALEARVAQMPSPFDDAELAELYLRRAQAGGDPADYQLAEARARRSLEHLPSPNPVVLTLAKLA
ncbi:MAG TPA: hypothetical protein VF469_05415, partial [Kofleriaceae bacterium]